MIRNLLTLLLCAFTLESGAQQFNWVTSDTIDYQLNPDFANTMLSYYPGHVVSSGLETKNLIYGQDIYGVQHVKVHDIQGNLIFDFEMGPMAAIDYVEADGSGKVYVAGSFMDTLQLNGQDTMLVDGPGLFNRNAFIICIDQGGLLSWKRNLSLQHLDMETIPVLTLDNNGNCWYAMVDFGSSHIYGTDANGQDVTDYVINGGIRTISGLSFDMHNNLYVSGAVENSTVTIGSFSKVITDSYNMFLMRFDANGQARWFTDIHDVTFQHPRVKTDLANDVFFYGNLMDSAVVGGFSIPAPQWNDGMILFKADSNGTLYWLRGVPVQPSITGAFTPAKGLGIAVDQQGGCVILGHTNGTIDWGNGFTTGSGTPGINHSVSIIGFNSAGTPDKKLEAQADYLNTFSVTLDSPFAGYITTITRGTSTFGPFQFPQPTPYTIANCLARFELVATGIRENSKNNSFLFYPNPADNIISFDALQSKGIFFITDVKGSLVKTIHAEMGTRTINLDLVAGYYVISLESNGILSHSPLIISH